MISDVNGWQDRVIDIIFVAIPAIIAALAAYYSAKKAAESTFRYNLELNKNKLKQQIYGELIGRKYLMSQLYILYFLSIIDTQNSARLIEFFNNRIDSINNSNKNEESLDRKKIVSQLLVAKEETLRNNRMYSIRSGELLIELAKSNELFWRTIGQIQILFEDDDVRRLIIELNVFEKEIELFEDNLKNESQIDETLEKLAADWANEKEALLKKYIKKYNVIIDDLLMRLSQLIK